MDSLKFSIVTPTYNSAEYLEDCIRSVQGQKYRNFKHIIVDGGSTDGTLDIIRKYEGTYPMKWISEKDNGMYDAINKGFGMASGDIYSWINSDDMYLPWTLQAVAGVMRRGNVEWCKGRNAYYTEDGSMYFHSSKWAARAVPTSWIRKGYCDNRISGFLQQESMFWKADLWNKAGGIDSKYRLAGDYHLWVKFAGFATLFTLNTVLAGFRVHKGQLSSDMNRYYSELPRNTLARKICRKTKLGFMYLQLFNPARDTNISIDEDNN